MNPSPQTTSAKPFKILWKINRTCNFHCAYCFDAPDVRANSANLCSPLALSGTPALASAFDALPPDSLLFITGGEPFLHPDFTGLCHRLSRRHRLSLVSNLSTPSIQNFADTLSPARTGCIRCSLHLAERERLNLMTDFREKILYLKARGFNACITEVISPATLPRLESLAREFKADGLTIWPILLRGIWNGRRYPAAYTRSEREQIRRYARQLPAADTRIFDGYQESTLGLDFLEGAPSFRHQSCRAGMDSIFIQPNGEVYRCPATRTRLGNLFDGSFRRAAAASPCPALVCTCPWVGYAMAAGRPRIYDRYHPGFRIRQYLHTATRQPATPFTRGLHWVVSTAEARLGFKLWPRN